MSTLDLSKIRDLALKRGIYDEYYGYIRFSDFKGGFNGFISRLIQDLSEIGITVSEKDIVEEILPISKLVVTTLYEGGFIYEIMKNVREKIRGDFSGIVVEKFIFIFIILLFLIKPYLNHKLNMKKLKDYKEFFKNVLNMSDEQISELLIKIVEDMEKKSEKTGTNLLNLLKFIKSLF